MINQLGLTLVIKKGNKYYSCDGQWDKKLLAREYYLMWEVFALAKELDGKVMLRTKQGHELELTSKDVEKAF